ncbi:hypothetical protein BFP70_04415 [Thioclava sp. SK-1]|uniref:DUF2177 family protein n=1 Tax=Thioclava sp. SK-1 TaxID=1889770 RepID=UPI0008264062|nr:DUF2177 family protein [Thioclava sp. SK-1]OCX66481.1 hypothetical protein BFP70_04415 [Thioclava sp. SK-1]
MQIITLYLVTTIVFLGIDAVMLKLVMKPLFDRHIADLYPDSLRVGPAGLFYLGYVAGLLYLVSVPALRDGQPMQAAISGAVLGLVAYGTYEFTNFATLRPWSWEQVITDTIWGGVLTGFSAWVGVVVVRTIWPAA